MPKASQRAKVFSDSEMKRFKALSTAKKIILISAVILFLVFAVIKYYFPQIGLSSWRKDINTVAYGEPDEVESKDMCVHFIDVGQGDCTLIKTESGSVLIDCGNSIDGDAVSQYLLSHNVETLEYLVITHPHSDHYGGAVRLADFIEIKNVLMPEIEESVYSDERDFIYLVRKLNKMKVPFIAARAGERYNVGDALFTVLSTVNESNAVNDMSLVLRLDFGETSFLFMGDCEQDGESILVNNGSFLKCDVLKVSHHGSSKGSTKEFLAKADPLIAVISCGYKNEYGHPGEDVLYRLKKNNASILRTDLNGNIVIGSDGEKLYCKYEKGKRY